eukprot:scaffold4500_cov113-Isochrysis_galbana.AAC.4
MHLAKGPRPSRRARIGPTVTPDIRAHMRPASDSKSGAPANPPAERSPPPEGSARRCVCPRPFR